MVRPRHEGETQRHYLKPYEGTSFLYLVGGHFLHLISRRLRAHGDSIGSISPFFDGTLQVYQGERASTVRSD
jgi:hypothetical protein